STAISPDGPRNIYNAVKTATSKEAAGKGVLVVMNEEIHTASEVTKTHSANVYTFASPFWGPIGYVDEDGIFFRRMPLGLQKIQPNELVEEVHLVKATAGQDGLILNALVEKEAKGIIIEGLGRGNVPPGLLPGIKSAVKAKIPIVLTTRVFGGRVLDVYGYEGGAKQLKELGVIMGGEISGQKARIKLMLALGITNDHNALTEYFCC
ncbi:MAG: asparaginase, partial [Bacillota bacterium]|nr:asparaginase [Bacillota bacterium]